MPPSADRLAWLDDGPPPAPQPTASRERAAVVAQEAVKAARAAAKKAMSEALGISGDPRLAIRQEFLAESAAKEDAKIAVLEEELRQVKVQRIMALEAQLQEARAALAGSTDDQPVARVASNVQALESSPEASHHQELGERDGDGMRARRLATFSAAVASGLSTKEAYELTMSSTGTRSPKTW